MKNLSFESLPITRKTVMYIVLGMALVFTLHRVVSVPALRAQTDSQKKVQAATAQLAKLSARARALTAGKDDPLLAQETRAKIVGDYLSNDVDISTFATLLPEIGRNRGTEILFDAGTPVGTSSIPGVGYVPVVIRSTGSYEQLSLIIQDLVELPKLVTLGNISIQANRDRDNLTAPNATRGDFKLVVELRAWYTTRSPLKEPAAAPKPSPSASPTPTSSPTTEPADVTEAVVP